MSVTTTTPVDDPVKAKIAKIRAEGETAFRDGKVKLFEGFPESLKHRANVSITGSLVTIRREDVDCPDSLLRGDFLSDVHVKVHNAALAEGLQPFTAGIHYPIHCTILEADKAIPEAQENALENRFADLRDGIAHDSENDFLIQPVSGGEYELLSWGYLTKLVLDSSGNALLMAEEIPRWLVNARQKITEEYRRQGFEPPEHGEYFPLHVAENLEPVRNCSRSA